MRTLTIVIALAVSACGVEDVLIGKDCTSNQDQSWDITEPDQTMSFKIEQCRLDIDECPTLCTYMMTVNNVSSNTGATGCEVSFDGGTTHIEATYVVNNNDVPGCAISQPGGF